MKNHAVGFKLSEKGKIKMNKFEKVSIEQYLKDLSTEKIEKSISQEIATEYRDIKLPQRATKHSAGYDFYAPFDIVLKPNETIKFATGIKCQMNEDVVLLLAPRSSLGFKYRLQLDNTIGVIDSDYYNNSTNEGHINAKITNDSRDGKVVEIKKGEAFMQGIFVKFETTEDDNAQGIRNGGIGSTDEK